MSQSRRPLQRLCFNFTIAAFLSLSLLGCQRKSGSKPATQSQPSAEQLDAKRENALALFKQGKTWEAVQLVHLATEEVAEKLGKDDPLVGKALFNESMLLIGMEDYDHAAALLRKAAAIPASDHSSQKDRLTYLMNLGDVLAVAGKLSDAEQVLRESLAERARFYGKQHSGYAYGLESLAQILWRNGTPSEGLALVESAAAIDRANGNPHLAEDLALRGFIIKAVRGAEAPGFDGKELLDTDTLTRVVQHGFALAEKGDPESALAAMTELRDRIKESGKGTAHLWNVLATISNLARSAEMHGVRVKALEELMAMNDNPQQKLSLLLALALAHESMGSPERCEASYREAIAVAVKLNDSAAASNIHRNFAIWLSQNDRAADAESAHEQAVAQAEGSGDQVAEGSAKAAYGVFLQHRGDYQRASVMLGKAIERLPATHADAFAAQNHFTFARDGKPCDCKAGGNAALHAMVMRVLAERLPKDLVEDVSLNLNDQDHPVDVRFKREPVGGEQELVDRAIRHAIAEIRKNSRR